MRYHQFQPKMLSLIVLISGLFASLTSASTPAEWRQMTSIYQVMVDRFARTDNSTTAPCDLQAMTYCGGTWQGLINRLDYIQGMGFDAVSSHASILTFLSLHQSRSGSLQFLRTPKMDIMDIGRRTFTRKIPSLEQRMTSKPCPRPFMPEKWYFMLFTTNSII